MTVDSTPSSEATQQLLEVAYSDTTAVDREAGVLRGVKVLGRVSRNGRIYSDNALQDAARLYEGVGVNIDHPERRQEDADRKLADRFGTLRHVRIKPDGIFADLEFLKTHSLAEQICEAATRMPRQLGLSHNAEGEVTKSNGETTVTSISRVRSVDLVQNPATTVGLFEAWRSDDGLPASERPILEDSPGTSRVEALLEELRAENQRLQQELAARKLLDAAGLTALENRVIALREAASEQDRAELIAQWARIPRERPRSASPASATSGHHPLPTDACSFARMLR